MAIDSCCPSAFAWPRWEAHDAPAELVDSALDIILPLERSIVAPAMGALGVGGVLDCQSFGLIQDGWWPGILDLRWLRRLTTRLTRRHADLVVSEMRQEEACLAALGPKLY